MKAWFAAAILVASGLAAPATAQDARVLTAGVPFRIGPATDRTPTLATFVGEAGAKQVITVRSAKPVEITLFEPGGAEMLHKEGSGSFTLTAYLSWMDVYAISITRSDPATPVTIEMTGSQPHPFAAANFYPIGLKQPDGQKTVTMCWEAPGSIFRLVETDVLSTLGADGLTITYSRPNGRRYPIIETATFDGTKFRLSAKTADGKFETAEFPMPTVEQMRRPPDVPYSGYYCAGATPSH